MAAFSSRFRSVLWLLLSVNGFWGFKSDLLLFSLSSSSCSLRICKICRKECRSGCRFCSSEHWSLLFAFDTRFLLCSLNLWWFFIRFRMSFHAQHVFREKRGKRVKKGNRKAYRIPFYRLIIKFHTHASAYISLFCRRFIPIPCYGKWMPISVATVFIFIQFFPCSMFHAECSLLLLHPTPSRYSRIMTRGNQWNTSRPFRREVQRKRAKRLRIPILSVVAAVLLLLFPPSSEGKSKNFSFRFTISLYQTLTALKVSLLPVSRSRDAESWTFFLLSLSKKFKSRKSSARGDQESGQKIYPALKACESRLGITEVNLFRSRVNDTDTMYCLNVFLSSLLFTPCNRMPYGLFFFWFFRVPSFSKFFSVNSIVYRLMHVRWFVLPTMS